MTACDLQTHALGRRVEDYVALLKPRVMSLVVFTAVRRPRAGAGQHQPVWRVDRDPRASPSAQARPAHSTCGIDADIDAVMSRTRNRPDSGWAPRRAERALTLGLVLSGFSVALLRLATNWWRPGSWPSRSSFTR